MAADGKLDFLEEAVADIDAEMAVLQKQLDETDQREALRAERNSLPVRLNALAEQARIRLADPDDKLMAEVFDLLELQLHLVEPYRFEGTGSIPIPDAGGDDEGGEFGEGTLRHLFTDMPDISCQIEVVG